MNTLKIKNWFPVLLMSGLLLGGFAHANVAQPSSHFVYIESNIAMPGQNSILGFYAMPDGSLVALPGSPFMTGGVGVVDPTFALGPFDSDQNLITNPEHTMLFAVNSGSNSIAVFNINPDGSLTPVANSPFPSYGINPVSVGFQDGVLVVVNKHQDPAQSADMSLPNYTSFNVSSTGQLTHIDGSTIQVASGSSPSQALVEFGHVFGADFLGGLLQSFALNDGMLTANMPVALPDVIFSGMAVPRAPLGLAVNPYYPDLYVGFPTAAQVGVYSFNSAGVLQFVRAVPNSGKAVCWLRTNAAGTFMYTSNSGDDSVSVYDLSTPDQPAEIQKLTLHAMGGLFQLTLDSSGMWIYVIEQRSMASIPQGKGNAIHALQIDPNTGKIMENLPDMMMLNLPGNTRPQGIVSF